MKSLLLFFVSVLCILISYGQTPIDVIFKKYSDKKGVDISIDKTPVSTKGDTIKTPLFTISKTLTFQYEDESDKKAAKLFQDILKDCNRVLGRKEYVLISADKDDYGSDKVYKKESGPVPEICELEDDEYELTLTITKISGLTKEMQKNFEWKTEIKNR